MKRHHEERYFCTSPKQVYTYHRSRSYTDIGVGSVKTLPKKKVKRVYLPETDDRGVGSSDLTTYNKKPSKEQETTNSFGFYEEKKTSSKCIGGVISNTLECLVSAKVSPIVHTKSGTTSPNEKFCIKNNTEIGSNTTEKKLVTATTQIEDMDVKIQNVEVKEVDVIKKPIVRESRKDLEIVHLKREDKIQEDKSFSSDSFVQHIHNLEQPSEDKSPDPMENKLEREYRKIFATKSKDNEPFEDFKSTSILRRRFQALRKSFGRKDEIKATEHITNDSKSSTHIIPSTGSVKDASVTSDPPSLEGESYSNTRSYRYTPCTSSIKDHNKQHKSHAEKKESNPHKPSKVSAVDSEQAQNVKGMFKLWGKKFNLEEDTHNKKYESPKGLSEYKKEKKEPTPPKHDDSQPAKPVQPIQSQKLTDDKQEAKKFFFFKKKVKDKESSKNKEESNKNKEESSKNKESYKNKKGVTTGRCEVRDGLVIKFGGNTQPKRFKSAYSSDHSYDELMKKAWLIKYLNSPIESRNSLKIRWNNKAYTTSSSTVFELMENIYKDTGVVIKSQSDTITSDSSSYYGSYNAKRPKYAQNVEAWMIPRMVPDHPFIMKDNFMYPLVLREPSPSKRKESDIKLSISDQKWYIDKSNALAHKIEVVLHSNNFVTLRDDNGSSDYLKIEIPKGFFSNSSSSEESHHLVHTSDEEVYKIIEYGTPPESNTQNQKYDVITIKHRDNEVNTEASKEIKITISVRDDNSHQTKHLDTVIKNPPLFRDVVTQGSNGPKLCDVIGVGIITQRDVRDVREPRKSILKVVEYVSDVDSEPSTHIQKKCEFAESYLQELFDTTGMLGIELFSCSFSDAHIKFCSANNSRVSLTYSNDNTTKSCPNLFRDFQTSTLATMSHFSSSSEQKKKPNKKESDSDDGSIENIIHKNSLNVLKKRKLYSTSKKGEWLLLPEKREAEQKDIPKPETYTRRGGGAANRRKKKKTPKRVSLADYDMGDTVNTRLNKQQADMLHIDNETTINTEHFSKSKKYTINPQSAISIENDNLASRMKESSSISLNALACGPCSLLQEKCPLTKSNSNHLPGCLIKHSSTSSDSEISPTQEIPGVSSSKYTTDTTSPNRKQSCDLSFCAIPYTLRGDQPTPELNQSKPEDKELSLPPSTKHSPVLQNPPKTHSSNKEKLNSPSSQKSNKHLPIFQALPKSSSLKQSIFQLPCDKHLKSASHSSSLLNRITPQYRSTPHKGRNPSLPDKKILLNTVTSRDSGKESSMLTSATREQSRSPKSPKKASRNPSLNHNSTESCNAKICSTGNVCPSTIYAEDIKNTTITESLNMSHRRIIPSIQRQQDSVTSILRSSITSAEKLQRTSDSITSRSSEKVIPAVKNQEQSSGPERADIQTMKIIEQRYESLDESVQTVQPDKQEKENVQNIQSHQPEGMSDRAILSSEVLYQTQKDPYRTEKANICNCLTDQRQELNCGEQKPNKSQNDRPQPMQQLNGSQKGSADTSSQHINATEQFLKEQYVNVQIITCDLDQASPNANLSWHGYNQPYEPQNASVEPILPYDEPCVSLKFDVQTMKSQEHVYGPQKVNAQTMHSYELLYHQQKPSVNNTANIQTISSREEARRQTPEQCYDYEPQDPYLETIHSNQQIYGIRNLRVQPMHKHSHDITTVNDQLFHPYNHYGSQNANMHEHTYASVMKNYIPPMEAYVHLKRDNVQQSQNQNPIHSIKKLYQTQEGYGPPMNPERCCERLKVSLYSIQPYEEPYLRETSVHSMHFKKLYDYEQQNLNVSVPVQPYGKNYELNSNTQRFYEQYYNPEFMNPSVQLKQQTTCLQQQEYDDLQNYSLRDPHPCGNADCKKSKEPCLDICRNVTNKKKQMQKEKQSIPETQPYTQPKQRVMTWVPTPCDLRSEQQNDYDQLHGQQWFRQLAVHESSKGRPLPQQPNQRSSCKPFQCYEQLPNTRLPIQASKPQYFQPPPYGTFSQTSQTFDARQLRYYNETVRNIQPVSQANTSVTCQMPLRDPYRNEYPSSYSPVSYAPYPEFYSKQPRLPKLKVKPKKRINYAPCNDVTHSEKREAYQGYKQAKNEAEKENATLDRCNPGCKSKPCSEKELVEENEKYCDPTSEITKYKPVGDIDTDFPWPIKTQISQASFAAVHFVDKNKQTQDADNTQHRYIDNKYIKNNETVKFDAPKAAIETSNTEHKPYSGNPQKILENLYHKIRSNPQQGQRKRMIDQTETSTRSEYIAPQILESSNPIPKTRCQTRKKSGQKTFKLSSNENIAIKLRDKPASNIKEMPEMKIKDAKGRTIVQRKDYKKSEVTTHIVNLISNDILDKNTHANLPMKLKSTNSSEKSLLAVKKQESSSIANTFEINFSVKVLQGDKMTEINIAREDDSKKAHIDKPPKSKHAQEVFRVKNDQKKPVQSKEINPKNDINIRITITSFKPNIENKMPKQEISASDDFSKKISKKFQTVSTGFEKTGREDIADNVYSVHKATIDLTSSGRSLQDAPMTDDSLFSYKGNELGDIQLIKETVITDSEPQSNYTIPSDIKTTNVLVTCSNQLTQSIKRHDDLVKDNNSLLDSKSKCIDTKLEREEISENDHKSLNDKMSNNDKKLEDDKTSQNDNESKNYSISENVENLDVFESTFEHIIKSESERISEHGKNSEHDNKSGHSYIYEKENKQTLESTSQFKHQSEHETKPVVCTEIENKADFVIHNSIVVKSTQSKDDSDLKQDHTQMTRLYQSEALLFATGTSDQDFSLYNRTSDKPISLENQSNDGDSLKTHEEPTKDNLAVELKTSEEPTTDTMNVDSNEIILVPEKEKDPIKTRYQEKKEMLKAIFENSCCKNAKNRKRMRLFKEVFKSNVTSDSSEPEDMVYVDNDLVNDITYQSLKPNYFKTSDSLTNYLEAENALDSSNECTNKLLNTAEAASVCSDKDSEWSLERSTTQNLKGCLCSTIAERLRKCNFENVGTGCCCRTRAKMDEELSCNILQTDEDEEDPKSIEKFDVEIENMYLSSNTHVDHSVSPNDDISARNTIENDVVLAQKESMDVRNNNEENLKVRNKKSIKSLTPRTPIKDCEYKRLNRHPRLGISDDDEIIFLDSETTSTTEVEESTIPTKLADVLQSYETKKAVLEIYAEKTVTENGEHLVAKLPKFLYEKEEEIYHNYESFSSDERAMRQIKQI